MRITKQRLETKHIAIKEYHETEGWSIRQMCRLMNISRSGYFKWLGREVPASESENLEIAQLVQEYDDRLNHILGYRRMTLFINHYNGTAYNRKRIRRIMRAMKIQSVIRKKGKQYTRRSGTETAENILKRNFLADKPNEKWATDVTEFKWYEGKAVKKLYLSAIIDLYDRSIVSYVISARNDNNLVFRTFDKAIALNPGATPIFHSDRGFQYTSKSFKYKLQENGMTQSMSRVGHCIDNGPIEGFWGILKAEMYKLQTFTSRSDLQAAIVKYIHFYNEERLQERFHGQTPMQVRIAALNTDNPEQYPIPFNPRIAKFKAKFAA